MIDQWYYWHDAEVLGPFSGKQLFDLAAAGQIIPTDTVWKDGVEGGVQASKVQHLFPPVLPAGPGSELPVPAIVQAAPGVETAGAAPADSAAKPASATPPVPPEPIQRWDGVNNSKGGKARAVAGTGAVIVGQDGKNVKFLMKCPTCSFQSSTWKTIPITRGTTRVVFYCNKCRKQKHAEVNGFIG
ncbi:MAG TPA: DUF4339 domain-containing protein [Gemmata sp.]|jgi:hypothetical protein|nr:DUF4339 domain-containing protein [Gemmata sp.]